MNESQLYIHGVSFPVLSRRELEQTLTPIQNGEFIRNINGELCYLVNDDKCKYASEIKGIDNNYPGFGQAWIGQEVIVHCIGKISETIDINNLDGNVYKLSRPFVKKSLSLQNKQLDLIEYVLTSDDSIQITSPINSDLIAVYSPVLRMRVIDFSVLEKEWGRNNRWRINLEEI